MRRPAKTNPCGNLLDRRNLGYVFSAVRVASAFWSAAIWVYCFCDSFTA